MITFKRVYLSGIALTVLLGTFVVPLSALASTDVPEIDGSSIPAALGLLAAGILIVRSRRRTK